MSLLIKLICSFTVLCLLPLGCSLVEDTRINKSDPKETPQGTPVTTPAGNPPVTVTSIDLTITTFNTAASYNENQIYNIPVTIKNNGPDAAGTFTVAIFSSTNANSLSSASSYTGLFAGKLIVNSLAGGVSTTVNVTYQPAFSFGINSIGAYIDSTEVIAETSEGNNHKVNSVSIN